MKGGFLIHQVIYVDVLILLNLIVNYLLLASSSAISGMKLKPLRIIISSALGSIYALVIFIPDLNILFSIISKILCSVIMILTAFKCNSVKQFLRAYASFFLMNFMFAGLMFAIWLSFKPIGMIYQNGAVYFDINAVYLTVGAVICYAASLLISHFIKRRAPNSHIIDLTIVNDNASSILKALLDTGNTLKESFSQYPVIICEYEAIKNVVPKSVLTLLNSPMKLAYKSKDNIRFVNFKSIGGSGLLPAFKPTFIKYEIKGKKYKNTDVYIAVYNKSLSNGEYNALMGNELLESAMKGENNHKKSFAFNQKSDT